MAPQFNNDGKVFVDRDPEIFRYVLLYLTNDLKLPLIKDDFIRELFIEELKFWGLSKPSNQDAHTARPISKNGFHLIYSGEN